MNQRLRLLCLGALVAMAASRVAPPNEGAHPQQDAASGKMAYEPQQQGSNAKAIVSYKPVKFDTSSSSVQNGGAHSSSGSHPYAYEETAPAHYVIPYSEEPVYNFPAAPHHHHHKLPHFPTQKYKHHHHELTSDPVVGGSPWRKIIKVLTAAIPIGLFIAALPPNVVHINSAQAVKPLGTLQKQRSGDSDTMETFPVLDMIEKRGGLRALQDEDCEANLFCEIARLGRSTEANSVQRAFWGVAHETPDSLAELLGARELFKAIRTDACSIYKCPAPKKASATAASASS